jgi:sugar phosphate isomerase/epimerase
VTQSTNRLGMEFISVLAMPPVDFVRFAAQSGCGHIGIALTPITPNPHGYPAWSLRDDPALRRDTRAVLADAGLSISLGEGFFGLPGMTLADRAGDLDLMAELGVKAVNVLSCDPDMARGLDELALFAEMASVRGLPAVLEFVPGLPIGSVPAAIKALAHVGRPDFRLLLDMMHVFRSGSTVADLAALDPATIGYIQICDVPLVPVLPDYAAEARDERLAPGEGGLPLAEALAVLPRDVVVGIEVPRLSAAQAGIGPEERLAGAVATTRDYLAALD